MRQSGLVMLLPHGYEGMGPEHSSARMERFLQMTEEDSDTFPEDMSDHNIKQHEKINWAVTNCSSASNYFHLLRRQVMRGFRKPLISMQPKSLLRLKDAGANMEDISEGTYFQPVLPETNPEVLIAPEEVKRVVFCCGKVYYDLAKARALNEIDDVAIARVEELAPFPFDKVRDVADQYPNAEVIWCQEEPLNQGPWYHVEPRIVTSLNGSEHHKGEWDVSKKDEFCIQNQKSCIKNDEFCIKNDEFCIQNDKKCRPAPARSTPAASRPVSRPTLPPRRRFPAKFIVCSAKIHRL